MSDAATTLSGTEHILFLTDIVPSPQAGNAGAKMFAYYIQELTRRGYRTSFIALGQPHELPLQRDLADQVVACQTIPVAREWPRRLLRAARRIAQPAEYALIADSGIEQALFQTLQRQSVDIIHALHPWLIRAARRAVSRLNTLPRPAIVGHVMDICAAQAFNRAWTGRRLKDVIETIAFARMARFEFRDYGLADSLLIHNMAETTTLRLFIPRFVPYVYSPIWFDAVDRIVTSPVLRTESLLLYVGNSRDHRTQQAVNWLLTQVLPSIKSEFPAVSLHIVSVYPEHFSAWHNPPTVVCHTPVSDQELLGLYDRASALLFPLRAGRYSQHAKVFNALARGCPTIMSSNANWSEFFAPNVDVLVADTASAFLDCIRGVLQNPTATMRLVANGLDKIRDEYKDPDRIVYTLQAAYSTALSASTPKG